MLDITRSADRYNLKTDWLDAKWHFSFGDYYDPQNVQFGPLRVFNNDVIQPGQGFPMHPHRDMEIVTYVLDGELEHRDSTGGQGSIRAGEVQRMSAGAGVRHSEFNASSKNTAELVQIWVLPQRTGVQPSYEQKRFTQAERTGRLLPIVSPTAEGDSLFIGQDATFYVSRLEPGQTATHEIDAGRRAYLFVAEGEMSLNGEQLQRGDSVKAVDIERLALSSSPTQAAELLLIDLP